MHINPSYLGKCKKKKRSSKCLQAEFGLDVDQCKPVTRLYLRKTGEQKPCTGKKASLALHPPTCSSENALSCE